MRVSVAFLTSVAIGLTLLALTLTIWQPWSLIVVSADLNHIQPFRFLGSSVVLVCVIVSGTVLALILGPLLARLLRRRWSNLFPALGHICAWTLLIASVLVYPEIKEEIRLRSLRECDEPPLITYVDRNDDYDEPRVRGLIISPGLDHADPHLPRGWPYSLLTSRNTLLVFSSETVTRTIVDELAANHYFQLPTQLDSRPSLDHAARYVALSCNGRILRAFGRLSDLGGAKVWALDQAILAPLDLGPDWWRQTPGRLYKDRPAVPPQSP